ncbi:M48 family metallopeptidase [Guggenheimella bovis]
MKLAFKEFEVEIERKPIRNFYLLRQGDAFVLRAPLHVSDERILEVLKKKEEWMRSHSKRSLLFEESERVPVLGKVRQISFKEVDNMVLKEDEIIFPLEKKEDAKELFFDFQKKLLEEVLMQLLPFWEEKLGIKVNGLSVRRMKTRYGSATVSKRTIRMNSRLAYFRKEVIESVLVHELVHFFVPNHGSRFYASLEKFLPNYWELHKELKRDDVFYD